MAQRATSLGPKPSLFFCFCFFCFVFCCFVFFGGFKGQVRWPKGPPHLALNPPYFLFVFLLFFSCFCFFVFLKNRKKLVFPLKRAFLLLILLCFPLFIFSLFGASSFLTFSFLVSLLLFSCFLPFCFSFLYFVVASSFCFVCFFFQVVLLVCFFFFSACCLVFFWIIILDLFLLCILFSCCWCFLFLLLSYFVIFWILETYQKHLWKTWKFQKQQKSKMQQKTDILTRTVSTGVFTSCEVIILARFDPFQSQYFGQVKVNILAKVIFAL